MFDLLKAKVGEATAFADGLVKLDALNMDRLLEEQEREERSKEESLRLLRASEETLNLSGIRSVAGTDSERASISSVAVTDNPWRDSSGGGASLASIEMLNLRRDADQFERHLSSPLGLRDAEELDTTLAADAGTRKGSLELLAMDDGSNFEDEFDPILASIRKSQQKEPAVKPMTSRADASARTTTEAQPTPGREEAAPSIPEHKGEPPEMYKGAPNAGTALAAGLLSILPGSMRARAGDVMAQSSAQISRSANAFRSALDSGGSQPALDPWKRRQSDPPPRVPDTAVELEEGMAGKGAGGGRRTAGARGGEEDEVRLVSADELLSEEESTSSRLSTSYSISSVPRPGNSSFAQRQQLAAFSDAAGGATAGGLCAWRRLRRWMIFVAVVALLGVPFYLWRWMALTVAEEGNNITTIGANGS